jgi:hypothetical protein
MQSIQYFVNGASSPSLPVCLFKRSFNLFGKWGSIFFTAQACLFGRLFNLFCKHSLPQLLHYLRVSVHKIIQSVLYTQPASSSSLSACVCSYDYSICFVNTACLIFFIVCVCLFIRLFNLFCKHSLPHLLHCLRVSVHKIIQSVL